MLTVEVVVSRRSEISGEDLARIGAVSSVQCDVTKEDDIKALVKKVPKGRTRIKTPTVSGHILKSQTPDYRAYLGCFLENSRRGFIRRCIKTSFPSDVCGQEVDLSSLLTCPQKVVVFIPLIP